MTNARSRPPERWLDVHGPFAARYQVSDLGRVRRLPFVAPRRNASPQHFRTVILRTWLDRGTPLVQLLMPGGTHRFFRVARLVSEAFLPTVDSASFVRFLNGNRRDCRLANLVRVPCRATRFKNRKYRVFNET